MRYFFFIFLFGGLLSAGTALAGDAESFRSALRKMVGEHHVYTLDFLVFKDLAEGQLMLTTAKTPGRYRAELVASTLGVASWLAGNRTQRYVSLMEDDGAGRLRSVSYESTIRKRKWGKWTEKQKRYRYDYQSGKVTQERGEDGKLKPGKVFDLPAGRMPVDILTGLYNLRAGVYGPLIPGAQLKIPTFTTEGISEIEVEVLTGQARLARPFFPATGTLLRAKVDPEIFDTGGADLYAWFDDTGRPARGIVENVIGLGDVYGRLHEGQKQP